MQVLVVEDEQAMAAALKWGLEAEGYVVDVADNGQDGLWKAREADHDVIILDVMLPLLDGYQVCTQLRAAGVWTPILMLTAMNDDLDLAEGLDSGADDYLPKPFAYPVLLARLRALTRRRLGDRPAVLTAAGLSLDPAGHQAWRGTTLLELTTREFSVLEYLLRAAGDAVAKADLLEHCWDPAVDADPSVVEVLIHRLRRKIDPPTGLSVIATVRGMGYRIALDQTEEPVP